MKTTGTPSVGIGLPYNLDTSTPEVELGQIIFGENNGKYIFIKAGAVALVRGALLQAPAEVTGDQNLAIAAAAVGATQIVTTSTVTVTANQYAGGYVVVSVTPGLAERYRIASHPAATAAALTLSLEEPLQTALTTSTRIDLIPSPYNGVVVAPTTLTSGVVGFAADDIAIGQYGWAQIGGVGTVKNDAAGALTVGVTLMPSSSVAGSVRLATAGNRVVAQALTGIASGETGAAIITLD